MNNDTWLVPVLVALITATPPTIVALLTLRKAAQSKQSVEDIHVLINSRMDQLLKSSKGESFAEGERSGRKEKK